MKKGNRVAKAAIEFESQDDFLAGFHLVGFTVCDDEAKGLFVLFPASIVNKANRGAVNEVNSKPFFFLRPNSEDLIGKLETLILDQYESMMSFNHPKGK